MTPWTVAHQVPLSMEFSRQEYCSGEPLPSPGDLPDPGIKPKSPALQADSLLSEPPECGLTFLFGDIVHFLSKFKWAIWSLFGCFSFFLQSDAPFSRTVLINTARPWETIIKLCEATIRWRSRNSTVGLRNAKWQKPENTLHFLKLGECNYNMTHFTTCVHMHPYVHACG